MDSINNNVETTIKEQGEKYGHDKFCKITMKGNIEIIGLINNKTRNITVNARNLMYKAHRTNIASKGKYKINNINEMRVILESATKKHVTSTYIKMQKPLMWRKFFINIADNRDYV